MGLSLWKSKFSCPKVANWPFPSFSLNLDASSIPKSDAVMLFPGLNNSTGSVSGLALRALHKWSPVHTQMHRWHSCIMPLLSPSPYVLSSTCLAFTHQPIFSHCLLYALRCPWLSWNISGPPGMLRAGRATESYLLLPETLQWRLWRAGGIVV